MFLLDELITNGFGQGKPLEFIPWIETIMLLLPAVGFKSLAPSHSMVVLKLG